VWRHVCPQTCFNELALWKSSSAAYWSSTKWTSSSFHWKLTGLLHDIAKNCWVDIKQQSLTHFVLRSVCQLLHIDGQSLVFIEIVIPSYDAPASEGYSDTPYQTIFKMHWDSKMIGNWHPLSQDKLCPLVRSLFHCRRVALISGSWDYLL